MLAVRHGHRAGLRELRRRYALSLKSANLTRLIEVAGKLGFAACPLRLELDDLPRVQPLHPALGPEPLRGAGQGGPKLLRS